MPPGQQQDALQQDAAGCPRAPAGCLAAGCPRAAACQLWGKGSRMPPSVLSFVVDELVLPYGRTCFTSLHVLQAMGESQYVHRECFVPALLLQLRQMCMLQQMSKGLWRVTTGVNMLGRIRGPTREEIQTLCIFVPTHVCFRSPHEQICYSRAHRIKQCRAQNKEGLNTWFALAVLSGSNSAALFLCDLGQQS
eukprot:1160727-Pelagomonas_calceolata.AAC.22